MRRRTFAFTAAATAVLAGPAAAQSSTPRPEPGRRPAYDDFRMHQDRTREFDRGFRTEFPPRDSGTAERRSRLEAQDREVAERAARQSMEEQDRRRRASPWSAAPWSDGRWGR